ncbi:MAG: alkyl sulfatase dimerization domain-containing protein [Woeseiaceae bacterium]|nr:alkyl sulfatase dimerization domain-containing protein [Woeseiaceae bacterium]
MPIKNTWTRISIAALMFSVFSSAVCAQPKDATRATIEANQRLSQSLAWQDDQDRVFAQRGFVGKFDGVVVRDSSGELAWNLEPFADQALDAPAPETVNPSLWRQATLNSLHGLFKVTDRVYQVRGYDLSNLSVIEGDSGYIVVDPLVSAEAAAAAMQLVYELLPRKPVVAVIYSHSHADHFGGVKGVVDQQDVLAGKVRIVASQGFMHFAASENVLAGNVMPRRASYMFGAVLPKGSRGLVDSGLGKAVSSGSITLIEPTDIIRGDQQKLVIDGVVFEFINTPFAEAPAEMMFYLPQMKAFYAAEEANATLHNLYTLRGAQVRDASLWSRYLRESAERLSPDTEVLFGGHHWPRWGYEVITDYLVKQADLYKYIHDQTLRLANHGYTMIEIAEMMELPASLSRAWFNRGYYGSVNHNVKAVYQKYLGWFDGNPANIHPLPPEPRASKYVAYMGGAAAVLEKVRQAFDDGDYRWVVEVVNHVIFADPDNDAARQLQADALEQLGYQAESAQWRNFYLSGASELRNGVFRGGAPRTIRTDVVNALSLDMIFDFLGVKLNGPKAAGKNMTLDFNFTDSGDRYRITIANGVLNYKINTQSTGADVSVSLTRRALMALAVLAHDASNLVENGMITVDGNVAAITEFQSLLDSFEFWFDIVTP